MDRDAHDPERSLIAAVRWAILLAMCLPGALASLCASVTAQGVPLALAAPLAPLAMIANFACWRKVIVRWRALGGPDDDDDGWPGGWESSSPLDPSGGTDGAKFDWARFEQDFWAHVKEKARQREHELIRTRALYEFDSDD